MAVDPKDPEFEKHLAKHNIYIEQTTPPAGVMQRAKETITRPRRLSVMDDETAQVLIRQSQKCRTRNEEIVRQFVTAAIPAIKGVCDERLERILHEPYTDAIPISLLSHVHNYPDSLPPPLAIPKPDVVFGYSNLAFTPDQLVTIDHLTDGETGNNFAKPHKNIIFPYLQIETQAQSRDGTHYVATKQTAIPGAIAINGLLELFGRSDGGSGADPIPKRIMIAPHYFSLCMDHEFARINMHWVSGGPTEGANVPYGFHVQGLAKYGLDDVGLRAVRLAVENILACCVDGRLERIREALDKIYNALKEQKMNEGQVAE